MIGVSAGLIVLLSVAVVLLWLWAGMEGVNIGGPPSSLLTWEEEYRDLTGLNDVEGDGTGVVLCIVDSGIDLGHPDLGQLELAGWMDAVDGLEQPYDNEGHGTAMAGIIVAQDGLQGIAPGVSLLVAKAIGEEGTGSDDQIADAVDWCVEQQADVISLSLGGDQGFGSGFFSTDALEQADKLFDEMEFACKALHEKAPRRLREWKELRIRQADIVEDLVSLPLQRVREALGQLIETSENEETSAELIECNRRIAEIRDAVAVFIGQMAEQHVYWVERVGRNLQNLSLNAAPIDSADFLRRRLFGSGSSVICASATLAVADLERGDLSSEKKALCSGLYYFINQVGAETSRRAQLGSPFDYEQNVKLYVAGKMPDPRSDAYADALSHWIGHFVRMTQGKAFVLFTNGKLMREVAEEIDRKSVV